MEDRTKLIIASIRKLQSRGAKPNIRKILAKTHPSDMALVLQGLDPEERYEVFLMEESFARRANVMSYLDESLQKELIELSSREDILKILSHMDSDDAADLLGILPEEESKEFLSSMVRKDSEEVAELMGYAEDSAGGLMSSEYLAVNQNLSVAEAVAALQSNGDQGTISFYLYVINDHGQLVGVVSLKQLLLSSKSSKLKELMYKDVISVHVNAHQEDVAATVERYDFLALPVVDGNNNLVGVITVDDVIDVIREEAEEDFLAMGRAGWGVEESVIDHVKARFPWVILSFLGGVTCFLIIFSNRPHVADFSPLWYLASLLPLLLSLGATTGGQAAAVSVGHVRSGRLEFKRVGNYLLGEVAIGLVLGSILALAVFGLGFWLTGVLIISLYFAAATLFSVVWAVSMGGGIPVALDRLGIDPTIGSVPLFTTLADISSVLILFLVYQLIW
ncbi:MAG TPA: magnesium transporter [Bdellovibrionales bacterium]|nr:magnesium transporter [Pseudobdellovibrionaceae bacterium]HAG91304.1 magnesium transporter [Bdellovibrionales bacterium]|tara:strand:+ start:288 stop:1634 length:1347 start_codon:yes stop_codon:yes gene_type:complete